MMPNCENCTKPHRVPDGLSRHPHFFCCDKEMPYDTAIVTEARGYLSHPGAREWLMRDVIEKSEQMAKTCVRQNNNTHIKMQYSYIG
jgi:hypothetical protein